jgi:polyferredoxin
MDEQQLIYHHLADALLLIHALFIAFVVFGLILITLGMLMKWQWTRNLWFRLTHMLAIGIVVIQAWLGIICPLTTWENSLREKAGDLTYAQSFIEYWLHKLIFYQAEPWVFTLAYSVFGLMVIASWYWFPPICNRSGEDTNKSIRH